MVVVATFLVHKCRGREQRNKQTRRNYYVLYNMERRAAEQEWQEARLRLGCFNCDVEWCDLTNTNGRLVQ